MTEQHAWMSDPLVADIPQKKLEFLKQLYYNSQGKNQKDLMTFMMPMMKKAKKENLTFTPGEMSAAIAAIKRNSTQEEQEKIDQLLSKAKKGAD